MNEIDSDASERDNPDDTDIEETDWGKREKEEQDDTDVKERDSGNKEPYKDKDKDHRMTIIPMNDPRNSFKIRLLTSYFLRNHSRNRPYWNAVQCLPLVWIRSEINIIFKLNICLFFLTKCGIIFPLQIYP